MNEIELLRTQVQRARQMFEGQVANVALDEALFAAGGWRSGLGVLKHIGGWLHVYRSHAFDPEPRHWAKTGWPRGLIQEVELTAEYLTEVIAWVRDGLDAWDADLASLEPGTAGRLAKLHWGQELPLSDIVVLATQHLVFHLGEFNMLLSIKREEAWEWTEEVEENHIDTYGHGMRPGWMNDTMASQYKQWFRAERDKRLAARASG